jgi:hypothetical protein
MTNIYILYNLTISDIIFIYKYTFLLKENFLLSLVSFYALKKLKFNLKIFLLIRYNKNLK